MTTYSPDYLIQKTGAAVNELATGFENARTRLASAYSALTGLPLADYPEQLQAKRAEIDRRLLRFTGREGFLVADNILKMKKLEISEVCELILDLHFELLDFKHRLDLRQARESESESKT